MAQSQSKPPSPHAIAQRYTKTFMICSEEHPDEGYGFEVCERQELARQNAILGKSFSNALFRISDKNQLRKSQKNWVIVITKVCQGEALNDLANNSFSGCMIDGTIRRTIWLEHLR